MPEEPESEFHYLYPTSHFKGRNIVDLDFVHKQLLDGHKACKTTLSMTQYQRKRLIGLPSILYLSLQTCSTVTMVKTGICDVKTKCVADMQTKFLLWYYLWVMIMLCSSVFEWTGYIYVERRYMKYFGYISTFINHTVHWKVYRYIEVHKTLAVPLILLKMWTKSSLRWQQKMAVYNRWISQRNNIVRHGEIEIASN